MERARQAELRRQLDIVAKAALVNSVKVKDFFFWVIKISIKCLFRNLDDVWDIHQEILQVLMRWVDHQYIHLGHKLDREVPVIIMKLK
jgi:hypothetical protein